MGKTSIMGRPLDETDLELAVRRLGVTLAHLQAVLAVEASGSGFIGQYADDPRLPKVLFEAHVFSRETNARFDTSHPQVSSPKWDKGLYLGGIREHDRLRQARELDFDAAYRSTSWGLFQVMGFNHQAAGYHRLHDFIGIQFVSEALQLECGINLIQAWGLDGPLRRQDWSAFARGYNGPGYKENHYHERLAAAFERYKDPFQGQEQGIKWVQRALNRLGFELTVDGILGPRTEAAVLEFQTRAGLEADGLPGPKTCQALAERS